MVSFPHFKFLYPNTQQVRDKVFSELLADETSNNLPARHIFDLFFPGGLYASSTNCQTIIIEAEYVCYDYMDSYVRYYYYAYRDYPKRCTRIHFFSSKVKKKDLLKLSKEQRDSYLGFVVIRPTGVFNIGRTTIAGSILSNDQVYILPSCHYPVNLAGNTLHVNGAVFMQQDTQVAACASASIWMVSTALSQRFNLPRYTTTQITEMATRSNVSLGRAVPSPGLTVAQMLEALRSMGYEPILYDPKAWYIHKMEVYKYVESELPVIIGLIYPGEGGKLSGHSIVVIGHHYEANHSPKSFDIYETNPRSQRQSVAFSFHPSTEWIPSFLANDDARGPYRTLEIMDPASTTIPREIKDLAHKERSSSIVKIDQQVSGMNLDPLYAVATATIVALPKGISLSAGKAEIKAIRLINLARRLLGWACPGGMVLRTFLQLSNEFKSKLIGTSTVSHHLKALYLDIPMPKYVWVTEISTKDYMNKGNPQDRLRIGEILVDSSASPWTVDFVSVHVPGFFMRMKPDEKDTESAIRSCHIITDDEPSSHLVRLLNV